MRSNSRQEAYSWLKRQSKKKLIQLSGCRNIKHFMREIGREVLVEKKLLRCI